MKEARDFLGQARMQLGLEIQRRQTLLHLLGPMHLPAQGKAQSRESWFGFNSGRRRCPPAWTNPITGSRRATFAGAKEPERAALPGSTHYVHLPAVENTATAAALPLIVQRFPDRMMVQSPKDEKLVARPESDGSGGFLVPKLSLGPALHHWGESKWRDR